MIRARGLTLLETLAATAILSLIAVVCIPLLRDARVSLEQQSATGVDLTDLGMLADAAAADPNEFDVEAWTHIDAALLRWPEAIVEQEPRLAFLPVRVTVLKPDESTEHAARRSITPVPNDRWMAFMCDDLVVFRWRRVEEDQEAQP